MIGFVKRENLARRPIENGDLLLLTKGVGIEGTSILSLEMGEKLASLDPDLLERARAYSSMISVVEEAMLAAGEGVKRMHDPTEGGVLGGLRELAEAHEISLRVDKEKIAVGPETQAICVELGLDPLKLISSGSLLCILPSGSAKRARRTIIGKGIGCEIIGRVEGIGEASLVVESERGDTRIEEFPTDEIWRMLA
jgi:hydrogenase maturation factor